jgi:hypothetical protein
MQSVEELIAKEKNISSKIKAIESGVDGCYPVIDGIIDVGRYVAAKYKILWVLKEVNFGDNKKSPGNWNMVEFYHNATLQEINNILTAKRVMLATHRILQYLDPLEAFKSIACINIKKMPGGSQSDDAEIQQAYNDPKNKSLLLEQIEAYSPDIMICGNTLQCFENDIDFRQGESRSVDMGKQRHYFCTKEKLYINAYHPANYRNITEHEYCEKIFNAFSYWEDKYRLMKG